MGKGLEEQVNPGLLVKVGENEVQKGGFCIQYSPTEYAKELAMAQVPEEEAVWLAELDFGSGAVFPKMET